MFLPRVTKALKNPNYARHASGFTRVGVVGLGLMGHGVAQVAAQSGFQVIAVESKKDALDVGMKRIEDSLKKVVARELKAGKIKTEEEASKKIQTVLANIIPTTDIKAAADSDVIVEAIIEIEKVKLDFYESLGKVAASHTIFASNTSSLPITNMALASGRPKQFVGLHFFNPVQVMKLVEVIRTDHTDPAVFEKLMDFGKELGKTPVRCKDTPGFIVNRLLVPYLAQAMAMVDRNDASITDIDISMQLGAGHPMGPLTLADYVGLDTSLNILRGWKDAHPNEGSFIIPNCLVEKVSKGELGRKNGKGFYVWEGDKAIKPNV